jgi:hypothetical protein
VVTAPPPPVDQTAPEVSGLPVPGSLVSVAVGQWSGTGVSYAYQWELCGSSCTAIPGATSSDLSPTSSEAGSRLEVIVTASNLGGSAVAVSSATGPVGTVAQDTAALWKALSPLARAATVTAVLGGHGATLPVSKLETGVLRINWYGQVDGRGRKTLIATGRVRVVKGKQTFKITLTGAGAKLLRHDGRRVRITAKGDLVGVGYALKATRQFSLGG